MDQLIQPAGEENNKQEEAGFQFPRWAWGAAAGAAVAVSGAVVTLVHFVGRRRRANDARQNALLLIHEEQGTPRGDLPTAVPGQLRGTLQPYDEQPPPPESSPFNETPVPERDPAFQQEGLSGETAANAMSQMTMGKTVRRSQPKKDEIIV